MPSPAEYLTLPGERVLIPDEASGTFTALIREFPGCVSQGDSTNLNQFIVAAVAYRLGGKA